MELWGLVAGYGVMSLIFTAISENQSANKPV